MQDHSRHVIIKSLPPSGERLPLFIVGDVHGCAVELNDLLKKAKERVSKFQLVLVGDLFTKGPDPVGVYEIIQEHGALCIKGNHDWALWASMMALKKKGLESMPMHTRQTLKLIRFHRRGIFELLAGLPHSYTTTVVPARRPPGWEAEYPLNIVHAGIDPTRGLQETSERMLLTVRYVRWEFLDGQRRLVLVPSGYRSEVMESLPPSTVYPGRAPSGRIYPPPPPDRFRWHEIYSGPELIVFGHDAKQGLFRKVAPNHRPICVGIDTGCTYGRSLTGYFPELDDAIQVPARRTYFDLAKNVIVLKPSRSRVAV